MSEISIHAEPPAPETAAPGPLPRRIADTFLAPVTLFRRFGPKAPWLDVMVISVVVMAAAMALIPEQVWVQSAREMIASNPRAAGADAESMAAMQRIASPITMLVFPWIMLLVQSAVLMVIFTMLMGGEATFRQYLAVGAHAALVGAVGMLATLPVIIQRGSVQASISLAALVPGMDADSFVYAFLNVFNVFLVWQVALTALGVAAVNRRASAAAPLGILFGLFAVIAALVAFFTTR